MLTVPQAARKTGKHPETIRRWIREGRLRASKVGTQHVIDDDALAEALGDDDEMLPVPPEWGWDTTITGEPMPNVVAWVRRSREGH